MPKQKINQEKVLNINEILGEIEAQLSKLEEQKAELLEKHKKEIEGKKAEIEKQLSQKIEQRTQLDAEIKMLKAQLKSLGIKTQNNTHTTNTPLSEFLQKNTKSAKAMQLLLEGKTKNEVVKETGLSLGTVNEMVSKYVKKGEIKEENGKIVRV